MGALQDFAFKVVRGNAMNRWAVVTGTAWVYLTYITVACAITSGLNIVHTKYILGIESDLSLFIVPTIAGIIFGYISARQRLAGPFFYTQAEFYVFAKYIVFSCAVTAVLNIVHTEWILKRPLSGVLFIAPMIAGVFFGYLLARIKTLNNRLALLATTDSLTQTANRPQFEYCLEKAIQLAKRSQNTFSVIYFDIDNFKQVNDAHGHHVGDELLKLIAAEVKRNTRKSDIVARYGGDEFVLLLPNTNLQAAEQHAHHLCREITRFQFHFATEVTCSFGVVEHHSGLDSVLEVLKAADQALYNAKQSGKNRVAVAYA